MKKLIRTMIMCAAALPVLAACSADKSDGASEGTVSFTVASDFQIADITKSNVSDYTTLPSADDFTIVVTNSKEAEVYNGLLKDYPADKALTAGNYNVTATYGSVTDEGFDKPCFKGSQAFTVSGGATNTVNIKVSLANAIIKVSCTDMFKNYYTDYTFTVKTGNGNTISFPKSETRAAFVDAYTISIDGTLTNQAGKQQTFSKSYSTSLSEATCYTLKFDASNIGSGSITITFDNSTDDVDLGTVELNK